MMMTLTWHHPGDRMNGSPQRPATRSLSPQFVRRLQLAVTLGIGVLVVLAYLAIPGVQTEVARAMAVLLRRRLPPSA
jgi:hypothetical protein